MYKRICVSMVIRDENYDIIKFKKFNHEMIEEIDGNEDVTIFDCCDKIDNLPNNIKTLNIYFCQDFEKNKLPLINNLPSNITKLYLSSYNEPIKIFPKNLEILDLGDNFNNVIENYPKKLKEVTYGLYYNKPIDNLPDSVTHIFFRISLRERKMIENKNKIGNFSQEKLIRSKNTIAFNKNINKLPQNLKYLDFGYTCLFNKEICKLPDSLEYIYLPIYFKKKINKIPKNIKVLKVDFFYNEISSYGIEGEYSDEETNWFRENRRINDLFYMKKQLNRRLNESISLIFSEKYINLVELTIYKLQNYIKYPESLKILNYYGNERLLTIPPTVKKLNIGREYNQILHIESKELEYIKFGQEFNYPIDKLPESVKEIEFVKMSIFNQDVSNLPKSLKSIIFGENFNKQVDKLPENLMFIKFSRYFNQPVNNLPKKLKKLIFCKKFNQLIDNLPIGLKYLDLGGDFNQNIDLLPVTLVNLNLSKNFNKPVNNLPNTLRRLSFNGKFNMELNNLPLNLKCLNLCRKRRNEAYVTNSESIHLFNQEIDNLPDSIEVLYINDSFDKEIKKLPKNQKKLYITYKHYKENDLIIPSTTAKINS